jgi:hypothetical protein
MPAFFKMPTTLFENWWAKDAFTLQLFNWILAHAAYQEHIEAIKIVGGVTPVTLQRGQMIIGRTSVCKALSMPETIYRNRMEKMERSGMMTQTPTSKFTIVTICNYDSYNGRSHDGNQEATNGSPTRNQQATTNKNNRSNRNIEERQSLTLKDL